MAGWAQRNRYRLAMLGMFPLLAGALGGCVTTPDSPQSARGADSARAPGSAERKAAIRTQLAVGYFEQGQYAVALGEIKLALAAEPDNAEALGLRGLIEQALGHTAAADENFRRARKLAPENPDLANNYGSFLCESGRVAEALPLFDAALANRAYRSPASAANNAGAWALKIMDYACAERYLLHAVPLSPVLAGPFAFRARRGGEVRVVRGADVWGARVGGGGVRGVGSGVA